MPELTKRPQKGEQGMIEVTNDLRPGAYVFSMFVVGGEGEQSNEATIKIEVVERIV